MPDKKRILVIDDDDFVRETICEVVEGFNYHVTQARSGAEALKSLNGNGLPDLVITDIIMPGKSGLEIIAEIRETFPAVKIIAISGGGGSKAGDILALARDLGSDRVISKPIDIQELRKALMELAG
ncbi:MAG: response regulator [Alphaproteobacteria bacterium]|nr:MAG: response regulator [Alphaproteobacteria bacterium]